MEIAYPLVQALVAAAAMAGLYVAIKGWAWRDFLALWLPLSILVWIILVGVVRLG
jgi:hypothetical protein